MSVVPPDPDEQAASGFGVDSGAEPAPAPGESDPVWVEPPSPFSPEKFATCMARKNLPLPEEKYFKDGPTTAYTIVKFIIDVNAIVEIGAEEAAVKVGEKVLFDSVQLSDAKDAVDDVVDVGEYVSQYMACAKEASIPEADSLRMSTSLDSLSEQAAQYAIMSHAAIAATPPAEPTLAPVNLVTAAEAESAAPATATGGGLSTAKAIIVAVTITILVVIFAYSREHPSNSGGGSGAATYSMYWSCGGSGQCASVMANTSDPVESGMSYSACQSLQQTWASNGTMQPGSSSGGTYCSSP